METAIKIEHCKDCVELLGDYADGALTVDQTAALESHLSLCMPCVTFLRTYKATSRLSRQKLHQDIPEELVASLHSFLGSAIPGFKVCAGGDSCASHKKPGGEKT
jgi:anti-sigma factor RsiW